MYICNTEDLVTVKEMISYIVQEINGLVYLPNKPFHTHLNNYKGNAVANTAELFACGNTRQTCSYLRPVKKVAKIFLSQNSRQVFTG